MSSVFTSAKADEDGRHEVQLDFDTGGSHTRLWLSYTEAYELREQLEKAMKELTAKLKEGTTDV